ncbi:hypothetical protein AB0O18_30630 [Streptomyces sp. NPDC093224]
MNDTIAIAADLLSIAGAVLSVGLEVYRDRKNKDGEHNDREEEGNGH